MSFPLTFGTGSSTPIERCQVCDVSGLQSILFLGYLPPVNQMRPIGERPREQPAYPALLLYCSHCRLAQLGLMVDPKILFPPEYPYTSGTTKILRDNFAELYQECTSILPLGADDLVVDVGSNDGTLLSNFAARHHVQGIEPSDVGKQAIERGIPTLISFFNGPVAERLLREKGPAKLVTATNVFAHVEDVHAITDAIKFLLTEDGVFISESHYLFSLLETLQYDTIYHEHLRYYSLESLRYLLQMHGLEVFHVKRIPTHGGSIRVYAGNPGRHRVRTSVQALSTAEGEGLQPRNFTEFKTRVVLSKLRLHSLLWGLKREGARICGIGAPSRASTLIHYTGLDDGILDCVAEIRGSYKIGKYMPGTLIPVVEESKLFEAQPEYALLLSWHIAEALVSKLARKGYKGKFIIPLPEPRILPSQAVKGFRLFGPPGA